LVGVLTIIKHYLQVEIVNQIIIMVKKLVWWFALELYTKCRPKGLHEGCSCLSQGKLSID
jgi:hypothetical protein